MTAGPVYKKSKRTVAGRVDEERVIMNEGDASSTATESEHGSDRVARPIRPPVFRNLRKALDKMVHSNKFNVFVVSLVIFNWLIVIVELLINLRIFELGHPAGVKRISNALYIINVSILGVFICEMWLKVIVGGRRFFKEKTEMFDFVVVVLAFSFILAFGGKENSADSAGLLVILRLWRVSKIINSMIEQVKHEAERKMAKERRSLRALEREVCKLREYCLQQDYELHTYRAILNSNCIPLPTVIRAPAAPRTLNVIAEVNEVELPQKQPIIECDTMTTNERKTSPKSYNDGECKENVGNLIESCEKFTETKKRGDDFDKPPKYSDEMMMNASFCCNNDSTVTHSTVTNNNHPDSNTIPRQAKVTSGGSARRLSNEECSTV